MIEASYCVYMHINKINKKKYVGQTCQKPEYRWNNGKGYVQCPLFYKAIQKYGWENFEHKILKTHLTADEANQWEKYYISFYDTTNPALGYNLQAGGENHSVSLETKQKCSENAQRIWKSSEHKEKISQIMKEKWQEPEYQEKQRLARKNRHWSLSDEGRQSISESRKAYIAQYGSPTQGKGHTEITKEKIRQSKLGEKNPMYGKTTSNYQKQMAKECNSVKIQCIETEEIFNSRKEAAIWCGLKSSSGIIDQIAGRKKSAGKHPITGEKLHWKNIE